MDKQAPVGAVVLRNENDEFLLVQEKWEQVKGLWNLPAGIVDGGETPPQTAIREAREEVGFKVKLKSSEPLHVKVSDRSGRTLYSYAAEIEEGELTPQPDEIMDARWMKLEEIEKLQAEGKIRDEWVVISIKKALEAK